MQIPQEAQAPKLNIPQGAGWRWQKHAGNRYQWVKGSGVNRDYKPGGKIEVATLPERPGKGNRTRGTSRKYRKRLDGISPNNGDLIGEIGGVRYISQTMESAGR